jgi:hypothetical protein
VTSLMSCASVTEEAFDELAIVAELHGSLIIDPLAQNVTEDDGLFKSTHRPPQTSNQERGVLRLDTQMDPPVAIARCGPSPTLTSESDRDEHRTRRAIRSATSLPSFHLPHRARRSWYRDRGPETPDLTSTSRSSLTSNCSAISRNSGLYTPPHSPPGSSFVHAEISTPSSHHHLSAISELQNAESLNPFHHLFLHPLEVESTQTVTKSAERSRMSSVVVRGESGGQAHRQLQQQAYHNIIAPRAGPGGVADDGHVVHHHAETDSPTNTLLASALTRTSPASAVAARSDVTFTQVPTIVPASASASPSPTNGHRDRDRSSRTWSFGSGKPSLRWSVASSLSAAGGSSKEEKRRKKEEARARKKERLAEELKNRSEAQAGSRAWEEDIAVYGGLASM